MKTLRLLAIILVAVLAVSCEQEQSQDSSATILCVTTDATAISQTSAVLNGTAIIKDAKASNANAYFYYSTTSGDAKTIKSSGQRVSAGNIPNSGGDFSYNLSSLLPSTTYYYVASVGIDDVEELGGVKSFTTEKKADALSVTGEYSDLGESSVKLYGWCNQEGVEGASVVYGIEYSKTDLTTAPITILASEKDSENKYCCHVTSLSTNTRYFYRAFALINGVRTFGEAKSFTTKDCTVQTTTLPVTYITNRKVTLSGRLEVESIDDLCKDVWFLYGKSMSRLEDLISRGTIVTASLNEEGSFQCSIPQHPSCYDHLDEDSTYSFVACSRVNGLEYYGEVKTFTTTTTDISIIIDGDFADWKALPEGSFSKTYGDDDAIHTALQVVTVFANAENIFVYFEWDPDQITHEPDVEHVPFDCFINTDGDTSTGGYGELFSDKCTDILLEGFIYPDGAAIGSYDPNAWSWAGEPNGYWWMWNDPPVYSGGICYGAGVEGKYEFAIDRSKFTEFGFPIADVFSIGFDIRQSWDVVGVLPNAAPSEENVYDGRANSLMVTTDWCL